MKTTTESLGLLLHDASRAMRRRFDARAATLGLSSAQWRLLASIKRTDNPTQARIAELLEIEPISVSRLIDRMEQGGWVTRRPHPTDRRTNLVAMTAQAEAAFAQIKGMADGIYADATAGLNPQEAAALLRGLRHVIDNLSDATLRDPAATQPVAPELIEIEDER